MAIAQGILSLTGPLAPSQSGSAGHSAIGAARASMTPEQAALTGDAGAWEILFERHNRQVVVALLARGVRVEAAKELAQDAWLRLIQQQRRGRLTELRLPGLAIAQAFWLARERARRSHSARPHIPLDDAEATALAQGAVDFERRILNRDQLACALRVLRTCSPSAQRVFTLLYETPGIAHKDVAKKTGLSVQRVRQILCEVRKLLRAQLGDGVEP